MGHVDVVADSETSHFLFLQGGHEAPTATIASAIAKMRKTGCNYVSFHSGHPFLFGINPTCIGDHCNTDVEIRQYLADFNMTLADVTSPIATFRGEFIVSRDLLAAVGRRYRRSLELTYQRM